MKTDAHITNQLTIHRQQYEEVEKYHLHKHQELISKEKVAKELVSVIAIIVAEDHH